MSGRASTRLGYLIFIAAVAAFCAGLLPLGRGDLRVYAVALAWASIVAVLSRARPRQAIGHVLVIFNIAYWSCYLALPESQWELTARLKHVKALLLGAMVALELGAAVLLVRGYRRGRRDLKLFPSEAFVHALSRFPMPDAMAKVLCVEFNIWSALLSRLWRRPAFPTGTYEALARLEAGYSQRLLAMALLAGTLGVALSVWLLPGYWPWLPLLVIAYLALLFHGELLAFRGDAVLVGQGAMVIANGVQGMLRVPLRDIASIDLVSSKESKESTEADGTTDGGGTLKVHRLAEPNVRVSLRTPLLVFGTPHSSILLRTSDVAWMRAGPPGKIQPDGASLASGPPGNGS